MFQLRPYQNESVEAWFDDIEVEGCNPLIALPTGSGKSVVLAALIQKYLAKYEYNEILILSHTQEIVEQDYRALRQMLPDADIGIFSAGLGKKEKGQITLGSIQSVYNVRDKFKWTNLIVIDEAHAVNHRTTGRYREMLDEWLGTVAGMSATIYRSGHGYLHEGPKALFNKVSIDYTTSANFISLVKQGYLSPLIPVSPDEQLSTEAVKMSAGDYNLKQLAKVNDQELITKAVVQQALHYGKKYKKWLVFAIDIQHCEHIARELNACGISAHYLHSKMTAGREMVINSFKEGDYRALVSVGMVTTGFDVPDVDLILMLRPTASPVLHVQMLGRGMRIAPGKEHCLVLDFAGNIMRLGPVNQVEVPKPGKKGPSRTPAKKCPECKTITHPVAKFCESCGHEFIFQTKLTVEVSDANILSGDLKSAPTWLPVKKVNYSIHRKPGKPDSICVQYITGVKTIREFWGPEHGGYFGNKSRHQLRYRGYNGAMTAADVYRHCGSIKIPKSILVDFTFQYPTVINSEFE